MNNVLPVIYIFFTLASVLTATVDADYSLLISKANNHFDSGQYDKALTAYKKAISTKKNAADAYFMLGHIHLIKGYYKIAYDSFKAAAQYKEQFLYNKTLIELYFNFAAVCRKLKYHDEELGNIKKVYEFTKNKQSAFYKKSAGKAAFILGLIYHNRAQVVLSLGYFLKAAEEYAYRPKTATLYIAYFYASRTQKEIDEAYKNTEEAGQEHNRKQYFTYYFYKYKKAAADKDDLEFMKTDKFKMLETECLKVEREFISRDSSIKNEKIQEYDGESEKH